MATAEPKIDITGLRREFTTKYGTVVALDTLDLVIPRGQFVCIVGPSGCGKSTLLRILAGLDTPTSGQACMYQDDSARPVNCLVPQQESTFPWLTVAQNIGYGLAMRGVPAAQRRPVVSHFLEQIGLHQFANTFPHQLSGGMKQRVSVARAFATDPEILLMDEPFAALDEQNKILLQEELLRIWGETRKTVVFITHSIDEALLLADRVVVMTAQPGRIKADLEVPFPRPRELYRLKTEPGFGELAFRIWSLLREEVLKARGLAG